MLTKAKKEPTISPITFVKEELNLALTKKGKWQFLSDLKENEEPLQVETFSFGDSYGVIRYGEVEESCIKIKGIAWYVVTDIIITRKKNTMSWNKNADPEKIKEYNRQYYLKKTKAKREALKKEKVEEVIVKVCPICNKEFTTTKKKTKYCSKECHMQYTLAQQKERRKTKEYKDN